MQQILAVIANLCQAPLPESRLMVTGDVRAGRRSWRPVAHCRSLTLATALGTAHSRPEFPLIHLDHGYSTRRASDLEKSSRPTPLSIRIVF